MTVYDQIVIMSQGAQEGWGKMYYHVLPKLIEENGFKVGAEVGVAYGGHSESILRNTSVEKLYSIDPYSLEYNNTDGYTFPDGKNFTQPDYEELYVFALHRLRNQFGKRSEFIRLSSSAAFAQLKNETLDFVFIDARHTYHDLWTDIYLWSKLVKPGGIIAGHDYGHESYPGIKQAVDEHFDNVNLEDGFVWWTKK